MVVLLGLGVQHCRVEGRSCAKLSGHLSGVKDRKAGMGVLWRQTSPRKSSIYVVEHAMKFELLVGSV